MTPRDHRSQLCKQGKGHSGEQLAANSEGVTIKFLYGSLRETEAAQLLLQIHLHGKKSACSGQGSSVLQAERFPGGWELSGNSQGCRGVRGLFISGDTWILLPQSHKRIQLFTMGDWEQNQHPTKQPAGTLNQSCLWWQPEIKEPGAGLDCHGRTEELEASQGLFWGARPVPGTAFAESHLGTRPFPQQPFHPGPPGLPTSILHMKHEKKITPTLETPNQGTREGRRNSILKILLAQSKEFRNRSVFYNHQPDSPGWREAIRALKQADLWCRLINICVNSPCEAPKCYHCISNTSSGTWWNKQPSLKLHSGQILTLGS